jgi:hypothetical protein
MRNMFTESLPSNGYARHNTLLSSLTKLLNLPLKEAINFFAL